jgi:SPP1 family predicted phage head-tail adaptor
MRAGRLDRYISIQRKVTTQSASGQPIATWSTLAQRKSASVTPVSGDERITAVQFVAREQLEFRIRYATALADVSPLDRVLYPALTDAEIVSPPAAIAERRICDIIAVHEIGRQEGLQIIAARRVGVA